MKQARSRSDLFSCRHDRNVWLGETRDRRIGFFNSEHVEEVLDDGRCSNVSRLPFLSKCLKMREIVLVTTLKT